MTIDTTLALSALVIPVLCYSVYSYISTQRKAKLLKEKGIGRGAPGFITNTKRVALPAELVRRIKAGEDVSAEEVTAALEKERLKAEGIEDSTSQPEKPAGDEWLPTTPGSGKNKKGKKRK